MNIDYCDIFGDKVQRRHTKGNEAVKNTHAKINLMMTDAAAHAIVLFILQRMIHSMAAYFRSMTDKHWLVYNTNYHNMK